MHGTRHYVLINQQFKLTLAAAAATAMLPLLRTRSIEFIRPCEAIPQVAHGQAASRQEG